MAKGSDDGEKAMASMENSMEGGEAGKFGDGGLRTRRDELSWMSRDDPLYNRRGRLASGGLVVGGVYLQPGL